MVTDALNYFQDKEKMLEVAEKITPFGRVGTAEDIAGAVEFFLTRAAPGSPDKCLWPMGDSAWSGMPSIRAISSSWSTLPLDKLGQRGHFGGLGLFS